MSLPHRLIEGFKALALQDEAEFDSTQAALLISNVLRPSGDMAACQAKLDELADQLAKKAGDDRDLAGKVTALRALMVDHAGFYGDQEAYDDLDHMNVFSVLETKCGTAITLGLIYIYVVGRCGWSIHPINFPAHCLLRLDDGAERVILDPFAGCLELDAYDLRQFLQVIGGPDTDLSPQFYENLSPKTLIMRHLNAIKSHFLRCEQMLQALDILQIMTILEERSATYWRETGLLQARIDLLDEAILSLSKALELTEDSEATRHTQHIIDDLKNKLLDR